MGVEPFPHGHYHQHRGRAAPGADHLPELQEQVETGPEVPLAMGFSQEEDEGTTFFDAGPGCPKCNRLEGRAGIHEALPSRR